MRSLAFNNDGSVLATGSRDKRIKLWDFKSIVNASGGHCIGTLKGNKNLVRSVAFSPRLGEDGSSFLISGARDGLVKIFAEDDTSSQQWKCMHTINDDLNGLWKASVAPVVSPLVSSNNKYPVFATCGDADRIRVYQVDPEAKEAVWKTGFDTDLGCCYSPVVSFSALLSLVALCICRLLLTPLLQSRDHSQGPMIPEEETEDNSLSSSEGMRQVRHLNSLRLLIKL